MAASDRYRLTNDVIHETFEGEVVIANLQGGSYYTLDGAGADMWAGLIAGASVGEIAQAIASTCTVDDAEVAGDVETLVTQLVEERLLAVSGEAAEPGGRTVTVSASTYEAPTFERYTDMQQLLLLDPIPDVDESGWPAHQ